MTLEIITVLGPEKKIIVWNLIICAFVFNFQQIRESTIIFKENDISVAHENRPLGSYCLGSGELAKSFEIQIN